VCWSVREPSLVQHTAAAGRHVLLFLFLRFYESPTTAPSNIERDPCRDFVPDHVFRSSSLGRDIATKSKTYHTRWFSECSSFLLSSYHYWQPATRDRMARSGAQYRGSVRLCTHSPSHLNDNMHSLLGRSSFVDVRSVDPSSSTDEVDKSSSS